MTADTKLTDSITSALNMSGLLFQEHPSLDGWNSTRAVSPEIGAFKYTESNHPAYISVKLFYAGETDADGYTYDTDTYEVEVSHPDGGQERRAFGTREDTVTYIADVMERIADADGL